MNPSSLGSALSATQQASTYATKAASAGATAGGGLFGALGAAMPWVGVGLGLYQAGSAIWGGIEKQKQRDLEYRDALRAQRLNNEHLFNTYGRTIDSYTRDIKNHTDIFIASTKDLEANVQFRNEAVQRGIAAEQRRLNDIYAQAAFADQGRIANLMENIGVAAAAGMKGRTADRFDRMQFAQAGRNMAIQAEGLTRANQAFVSRADDFASQAEAQNRMEARGLRKPMFAQAPMMPTLQRSPTAPVNNDIFMQQAQGAARGLTTAALSTGKDFLGLDNQTWQGISRVMA